MNFGLYRFSLSDFLWICSTFVRSLRVVSRTTPRGNCVTPPGEAMADCHRGPLTPAFPAFWHLPVQTVARLIGYVTAAALRLMSARLPTDTVSAVPKVWVLTNIKDCESNIVSNVNLKRVPLGLKQKNKRNKQTSKEFRLDSIDFGFQ